MHIRPLAILAGLGLAHVAAALSAAKQCITFPTAADLSSNTDSQVVFGSQGSRRQDNGFLIASNHPRQHATSILLDSEDNEAIHVAAQTFADDVWKVTGLRLELHNDTLPKSIDHAIIVGSVSSRLIGGISSAEKEVSELEGKWESYDIRVRKNPLKGIEEALVVIGSDRRGTIYALYTMSEQMGVSPFHYWSDVPIRHKDAVAFSKDKTLSHGEPTVKYRGVFINDEHPAMWGWAAEKKKIKEGEPAFLPDVYEPWFEMMLRLKANYFWPAMYASMFDVDGVDKTFQGFPQPARAGPNQVLANRMGVVMGSSHHEPMSRNKPEWDRGKQGEWDWTNSEYLTDWWTYGAERAQGMETMFTLGMRGDGDEPLTGASNKLVENITHVQQGILKKVYGDDSLSKIPQMWCMYKEVAEYFVNGLEVPPDVQILFADDNYGNIMTVQPPGRNHPGGAGIYYHVDYVGMPRAYKWIQTINLAKTWEQMSVARAFNTTAIWIVNVGTLKPLEMPTEHFLSLAYDLDAWPRNSVGTFLEKWAAREFGEEVAFETAEIMSKYMMYSARNKAELVNSTAWSLTNYEEAERVLAQWEELVDRSGKVYHSLNEATKPAYFELVYMLCLMQHNLNKLYIAAGRSNQYAFQARNAANVFAKQAIEAFEQDSNLTETFHSLLDRKWDHMLDQSHIAWYDYLEPMKDHLPPITFVNPNQPARQGIPIHVNTYGHDNYIRVTVENSLGHWPGESSENCGGGRQCPDPTLLPMDRYGSPTRWIEIGASGPRDIKFSAKTDVNWLKITPSHGKILRDASTDQRLRISVDWSKVTKDTSGKVSIVCADGSNVNITVPVISPPSPPEEYHGFVQGDGYVVMEAAHFARNASSEGYAFEEILGYGRTLSGFEMFPMTTQNFTLGQGPSLSYDFWTHAPGPVEITVQMGPTLNFLGIDKPLSFGLQLDNRAPVEYQPIPTEPLGTVEEKPGGVMLAIGAVPKDWINIVKSEIRNVTLTADVLEAGQHNLTIWGMTTGLVFERIWIDLGGIKKRGYSYLGPPESLVV